MLNSVHWFHVEDWVLVVMHTGWHADQYRGERSNRSGGCSYDCKWRVISAWSEMLVTCWTSAELKYCLCTDDALKTRSINGISYISCICSLVQSLRITALELLELSLMHFLGTTLTTVAETLRIVIKDPGGRWNSYLFVIVSSLLLVYWLREFESG